jgi:hypothetical protein
MTPKKVVQVDEAELLCRMAEAFGQSQRPQGMTATEAVAAMSDEMRADWLRAARAAQKYWFECIELAATVQ